eukprot:8093341-Alexandrium_andersonii.AAC.1
MGTRSFFYHDCQNFVDACAFDYSRMQEYDLEESARKMVHVDIVRRRKGTPRSLPREYVAIKYQPQYAPEEIIMLRRANCRSFFPQLAQWHLELGNWSRRVCQNVGRSVTIALRHIGELPRGVGPRRGSVRHGRGRMGSHHAPCRHVLAEPQGTDRELLRFQTPPSECLPGFRNARGHCCVVSSHN